MRKAAVPLPAPTPEPEELAARDECPSSRGPGRPQGGESIQLLVGGGVWVFVNPALRGPGYVLLSAGMGLVALSIATTVVSGLPGDRKLRFALPRRPHSPVPHG
jgi:hypothetical protein